MKMNKLPIQLWQRRVKWPTLAVGGLVVLNGLIATLLVLQNHDLESQRNRMSTLRTHLAKLSSIPQVTTNSQVDFGTGLGQTDKIEDYLAALFAAADKAGIKLHQGTYRLDKSCAGQYWCYYIELPVTGGFDDIRRFIVQFLLALPFSALENITVSRATVAQSTVDGSLRFVLFLKPLLYGVE